MDNVMLAQLIYLSTTDFLIWFEIVSAGKAWPSGEAKPTVSTARGVFRIQIGGGGSQANCKRSQGCIQR